MKHLAAALVALLLVVPAAAQEGLYRFRGGQRPVDAQLNGYRQEVRTIGAGEVEVRVTTTLRAIGASGPFRPLMGSQRASVPAGFELPPGLRTELHPEDSAWQAATRILVWVMRHIALDDHDDRPQDARAVLERRRGRCSGLANATAALLIAAGFQARTVSGLLIGDGGGIPHRWLEVRLPGAGWVPTDPTLGLWTITPRHVAFRAAVSHPPEVTVLAPPPNVMATLPLHDGIRIRPNVGIELICRIVGDAVDGTTRAVLEGPRGERLEAHLAPDGRFSGLLPGRWLLRVLQNGAVVRRQRIDLHRGPVHTLAIELPQHRGSSGSRTGGPATSSP